LNIQAPRASFVPLVRRLSELKPPYVSEVCGGQTELKNPAPRNLRAPNPPPIVRGASERRTAIARKTSPVVRNTVFIVPFALRDEMISIGFFKVAIASVTRPAECVLKVAIKLFHKVPIEPFHKLIRIAEFGSGNW
jgi:hypothetical protein